MRSKKITFLMIMLLTGAGLETQQIANAQSIHSASIPVHDILLGAAASPAMGMGNGNLLIDPTQTGHVAKIKLAQGANAFQIALVGNIAYVPTLQGTTYIVDWKTHQITSQFTSPKGARISALSAANHLLLIAGGKNLTAYAFPSHKVTWQDSIGGNALSIVGNHAYLSSNTSNSTTEFNVKNGHVLSKIPVGGIEDSVIDPQTHTLWLANWKNGDMTVLDTQNNHVLKVIKESEGGGFSMNNMMNSTGGFMQLAVDPKGKAVYAASFSGNIMVYNAQKISFEKNIPIDISMAKLSGIAIDPSDQYAYTTVENKKETVRVSLQTGKIVSTYANVESNRWNVIP